MVLVRAPFLPPPPNRAVHVPATVLLVRYWQKDMKSVFLGTLLGYLALFSVCM